MHRCRVKAAGSVGHETTRQTKNKSNQDPHVASGVCSARKQIICSGGLQRTMEQTMVGWSVPYRQGRTMIWVYFPSRQEYIMVNTSTDNIQQNVGYAEQNSSKVPQNICLISCTNIVRVDSPNHPRLLLALTKNRAAGSTTKGKKFRMRPVRFENNSQVTYAFEKWYHRDVQV